ncbi:MAG: hypothetical protein ABIK62_07420, partial [candidate division WOR-3 bacterium]
MTLLALCLLGQVSGALNGPKVTLSGSSSAYGELSHFITDSGPESEGELRWSLSPVVRVSGVPLGLDLLLSTRENPLRQALNKFRLSLGSRELLRTLLQRPDFGLVLPSLELGTSCPNYSELTLSGVPVNGLAFELEPWSGYLAGAVGRTQRAAVGSAYARMLYAGRLGVGKQTGSHCYLTLLHARDDSASIPPVFARPDSAVDSLEITKPQENYLAGLELGFVLLEGRLR